MSFLQSTIRKRRLPSGRSRDRLLKRIHAARQVLQHQADADLAVAYQELRQQHEQESTSNPKANSQTYAGQFSDAILVQAFALGMEALRRTTGMIAYDVQLFAGLAMARGSIAEMQTGEGKTLTTMFPIAVMALSRRGVHVATVNAYLAKRDFEFLQSALTLLGITAGILSSDASADEKRDAYACDVTFGTGYEFGFDFLRDQISLRSRGTDRLGAKLRRDLFSQSEKRSPATQRGFAAAIIDEVDSVFIDEATTPLVLSSGSLGSKVDQSVYFQAKSIIEQLVEDKDFTIDRSNKTLSLTDRGVETVHQARNLFSQRGSHPSLLRPWRQYVESALRAQWMMVRNIHYVVRDDKIQIVDEYTGRIFSDRNWRDGLHQAVEAKEGVTITEERKTIARISRQRYFQRYEMLCGMTGTANGHQREFQKCYGLPIVVVPRQKPLRRVEFPTRYFKSQSEKTEAIVKEAMLRGSSGQPVLIGTRTIQQSMLLSTRLHQNEIPHQVLNGVQDEEEATLIASAGKSGSITVATNMAGRGTDITLDSQAIAAGGLHVIGFERNSSGRIDRQLLGRSGRQGDPGSGQFFVSAEDEIVIRFDRKLASALSRIRNSMGVESRVFDRRVQSIQRTAEQSGFQMRQSVMREELWLDKVKKVAG